MCEQILGTLWSSWNTLWFTTLHGPRSHASSEVWCKGQGFFSVSLWTLRMTVTCSWLVLDFWQNRQICGVLVLFCINLLLDLHLLMGIVKSRFLLIFNMIRLLYPCWNCMCLQLLMEKNVTSSVDEEHTKIRSITISTWLWVEPWLHWLVQKVTANQFRYKSLCII